MSEETKNGTPGPLGEKGAGSKAQMQCSEFESLLMEAIDGQLSPGGKESFDAHRQLCEICGPMFAEVEAGRLWLRSLEPVEPPQYLVHNILVATTGVVSSRAAGAVRAGTLQERIREWWDSWISPAGAMVRQPRFVMSFGMIFFTFSLVMSVAGVKASDVAKIDLRPAALRHAYNDAQIKVVQYYDNIRFVYEIESRVRELKRANTPAEPAPAEKKENHINNNTSGPTRERDDRRQNGERDRNYSQEQGQVVLAGMTQPYSSFALRATPIESRPPSTLMRSHNPCLVARSYRRFV